VEAPPRIEGKAEQIYGERVRRNGFRPGGVPEEKARQKEQTKPEKPAPKMVKDAAAPAGIPAVPNAYQTTIPSADSSSALAFHPNNWL
jgi:hypothetical protein